jgi:hypothetical protein
MTNEENILHRDRIMDSLVIPVVVEREKNIFSHLIILKSK